MKRRASAVLLTACSVLVAAGVFAGPSLAASNLILPRSGQVGLGIQGEGGTMLSSGNLGKEFGSGGGLAVRVRYRMRFERAIGLTFDAHQLSARDAEKFAFQNTAFDSLQDAATVSRDRLKLVTAGIEFYQMFDTRTRTTKYVSAGVGLAQLSAHLTSGESQFPIAGDGLYISAGAGLERFFFRSMAWDMGARYMAIFHDGEMNHDLQLQAGLIFYAAY